MKVKHNKKRNTAFVYEALLREGTLAILRQQHEKKKKIVSLIKKHFKADATLRNDLECYRSLYESYASDRLISEKILKEAKKQKEAINHVDLFKSQTALINDINKEVSPTVFSNYVPNYKTLATIAQIFSNKTSPKNKVLLETQIVEGMLSSKSLSHESPSIDNTVYRSFVNKFNDKYNDNLLEEQRNLLTHYINSFADNALELKIFLNEEIARMKEKLQEALSTDIISQDSEMIDKTRKLILKLESYRRAPPDKEILSTVLKTQQIVKDIFDDGSNN